jgi:CRP/FNR family transcriptional regulator, anaerobic regulatory protein
MNLPTYIKSIAKISAEAEKKITSAFKREELPKGHLLFAEGEVCRHIYFIEEGGARAYYISSNGRDITAWFFPKSSFLTAVDSFYHNTPTNIYCELLEDSVVYSIKYSDFEEMMSTNSDMAKFSFHVVFELAKLLTEFIINLKFQTAEERYTALVKKYPAILQRVSLGHIASFLGITQETLSRIRGKN